MFASEGAGFVLGSGVRKNSATLSSTKVRKCGNSPDRVKIRTFFQVSVILGMNTKRKENDKYALFYIKNGHYPLRNAQAH